MGKKQIQALEDVLGSASVALPTHDNDKHHFRSEMYPYLKRRYEDARADVEKLGLTVVVEAAIRDCLVLAQQGRRAEAQRLLLDASIALSEKSGTMDEMRRIYTAANDSRGR